MNLGFFYSKKEMLFIELEIEVQAISQPTLISLFWGIFTFGSVEQEMI